MNNRRKTKNRITGLLLIILLIFAAATRGAQNGKIAFASDRNGNAEIYVMNADGSNRTQLTNNPADSGDFEPAFSPDGMKIAFTRVRFGDGGGEIYLMNPDGSSQTRLTNNTVGDSQPAWSPDGSKIAYIRDSDKINVMNADGSGQTTLHSGVFPISLDWSPDGTKIIFGNWNDGIDISSDIFMINADGSGLRQISSGNGFFEYYYFPAFSPDGTRIVFAHELYDVFGGGDVLNLHITNADGSNAQAIGNGFYLNLDWSPDGTKVIFNTSFQNPSDIVVMNQDGSGIVNLTNSPASEFDPSWAPAGMAAVSGRVSTPDGRGLRNASVTLTDPQGRMLRVTTSSFGLYRFDNVQLGETYVIGVLSKRYRFASRTIQVTDNLSGVDLVGLE